MHLHRLASLVMAVPFEPSEATRCIERGSLGFDSTDVVPRQRPGRMLVPVVRLGDPHAGGPGTALATAVRNIAGGLSTMPLSGTYEPSPSDWARDHVERFEASGGAVDDTPRGAP